MSAIGPLSAGMGWVLVAWAAVWMMRRTAAAQKREPGVWILLLAGGMALRLPQLLAPHEFSPDESQSLAGAATLFHDPRFWISVDGATAGPLHFFALLPAAMLPGPAPYFASRVLALGVVLACIYLASRIAARRSGDLPADIAALTAAVAYSASRMPDFQHFSTELVALLCLTIAIAALMLANAPLAARRVFAVGLLAGAAPLAKLQAVPLALFVLGLAVARAPGGTRAKTATRIAVAALLPLLAAAIYLTFVDGWNAALIGYGFNNASYVQSGAFPWHVVVVELSRTIWEDGYSAAWILTGAAVCLAALIAARGRGNRRGALLMFAWLAVALVCVFVPRRPYPHYLYWLLPPAVYGLALALGPLLQRQTSDRPWRLRVATAILAALLAPIATLQAAGSDNFGWLTRLFARYHRENVAIASLLSPYQRVDDRLAIWGSRSDLYVTAGLAQAIPQAHSQTQLTPGPWQRYFIAGYVQRLVAVRPFAFVDAVGPGNFLFEDRTLAHEAVPALRAFIASEYTELGEVGGARVYLRIDRRPQGDLAANPNPHPGAATAAVRVMLSTLLFIGLVLGLGAALAPPEMSNRGLALCIGVAFLLGVGFLIGFGGFIAGLDQGTSTAMMAIAAVIVVALRGRTARPFWSAPPMRELAVGWLIFAAWCLGLLSLVRTYSGGGWAADWVEHWQRAIFFREHQPLGTLFAAVYPLTARPPLANVLTAAWLELTGAEFFAYQVFLTLFGSLILLPAWTLARMWSKSAQAGKWTLLLLMLSPLVAQNVTFAWTKLPTAFFVLTAIAALVQATRERSARVLPIAAACLAFGLLTHYSAGPWILALAVAAGWCGRRAWRDASVRFRATVAAGVFAVIVAPWFGWAALQFGMHGTALGNSTAAAWADETPLQRVWVAVANLFDTVVPFPLRHDVSLDLIAQTSGLGRVRDVAFNLYQLNLLFACGAAGLLILARAAMTAGLRLPSTVAAKFLAIALPLATVIGVWVHTPRDEWGLAHICLQPLAIIGLVGAATCLADRPRLRRAWAALAAVDFIFGIALHFTLQSWPVPRGANPAAVLSHEVLNHTAATNACDKLAFRFEFLADLVAAPPAAVWISLAALLAGTMWWLGKKPAVMTRSTS